MYLNSCFDTEIKIIDCNHWENYLVDLTSVPSKAFVVISNQCLLAEVVKSWVMVVKILRYLVKVTYKFLDLLILSSKSTQYLVKLLLR